jgi:hypothetical protein
MEDQRFIVFQREPRQKADSMHILCVMFANQHILKHLLLVVHVIN